MTDSALVRPEEPELTTYEVIERVISSGDLSRMEPVARVAFYWRTCESLGLNPLTRPFEFLSLDGKTVLYARKDATDQLRRINHVSITGLRREYDPDQEILTLYARGRTTDGREDESSGSVSLKGLGGQHRANAMMKAETKAKRRVTLSLVGLGFLDESEVEGGTHLEYDPVTGVLETPREQPAKPSLLETVQAQTAALATDPEPAPSRPTTVQAAREPVPAPVAPPEPEPAPAPVDDGDPDEPPQMSAARVGNKLTLIQFSAKLTESGLDREKVRQQVKLMYPAATRFGELTEEQLAEVWDAIAPVEEAQVQPLEDLPDTLLAEPMPVAMSQDTPVVCGEPSPFGGPSVCTLPADHQGNHRASANETW